MTTSKCPVTHLTMNNGAPVADNQNSLTAGPRGPLLAQDLWLNEKLADFVREVIPERRMHAKGSGAFGTRHPRLCVEVLYRRRQLGCGRQQHTRILPARPA